MPYNYYENDPRPIASPTTTDEALAIWASMDERGRLLMAKTAPSYASKWGEVFAGDSEHEFRGWHHDTPLPGYVEKQSHDGRWHAFCFGELDGSYKRLADAKSAVDSKLSRLGYVLEDDE